ncbi:MAG: signal peptidase I [Oscillospiraceae bacterium]|nr:signal peptidase I [Oscillospiraceae bacterium]
MKDTNKGSHLARNQRAAKKKQKRRSSKPEEQDAAQEALEEAEAVPVSPYKETYEWIQCLVLALIVCVLLFVFVARVIDVVGYSMVPTLDDGDKIIITRWAGDYEQGDIVVLRKETLREEPIVKRVIAVEGQTVDIDFTLGIVYVDGVALDEPYVNELTYTQEDFEGPITVPEGCVFVMGDNRNNSTDSRDAQVGCVDTRYIMGKVIFRIMPLSKMGAIYGSNG